MRRLPEMNFLNRRLQEGKARNRDFEAIAQKIAHLYATAASDRARLYGSAEAIGHRLEHNLKEIEPFIGQTVSVGEFRELADYTNRFFAQRRDLLERRLRDGRVREGHGDVRAEHICLQDDPVIFDCIEFSDEFRYCDAALEIAFLAMDVDYLGSPLLSDYFVECFQKLTRDAEMSDLLPVYKSYRACVRGKVESLKSREQEVPQDERSEASNRAQRYFHLAHRYVTAPFPPALLIVCGLTASGKSTLARALGDRTGYQIINSDVVRKQLAGVGMTTHPVQAYREGIYSDDFSFLTYGALLNQTENCLRLGKGVIADATFKEPRHRSRFIELSRRLRLPMLFVECRASEAKTLERLKMRQQRHGDVSDGTIAVYLQQRDDFVPLTEIPEAIRIVVNTETDADETTTHVVAALQRTLASQK
jgi:predicted kinase